MPIVNEESFQFEEENISNQGIEECTNKVKDSVDGQNKNVVEETNEIIGNQINEKNYPFDLNEIPEDED
uniref:Candidate secreted effector n=1 Tax=Meloidogyne incognita TaxID=6306 RepID=A0A914M6L6_MELIC